MEVILVKVEQNELEEVEELEVEVEEDKLEVEDEEAVEQVELGEEDWAKFAHSFTV